ncbi:MAG: hypothetical protein WKF58_12120 [Ilumatobacteraceae bacterium]
MRTGADHPARVRDPAIELLLSHTATLTDEWRSPGGSAQHSRLDLRFEFGMNWLVIFGYLCGPWCDYRMVGTFGTAKASKLV